MSFYFEQRDVMETDISIIDIKYVFSPRSTEWDYTSSHAAFIMFMKDVAKWCKQQTGNEYKTWDIIGRNHSTIAFENEEDAMMFKMRWS